MTTNGDWIDTAIRVVEMALRAAPNGRQAAYRVAEVTPDSDAGWFVVRKRVSQYQIDAIGQGRLRAAGGAENRAYDILEVAVDGEIVRVRSAAPQVTGLALYAPTTSQRDVLGGLSRGLAAVRGNPLLTAFAEGKLDGFDRRADLRGVHAWPSLRPAQQEAVRACCAPGVQLVWGPPGTGKTHVIAAAMAHLVATGSRVLLVSATNVAVDTALHGALRIAQPGPGEFVRVGAIHDPRLVADARVNLVKLVESRQSTLQRRLAEIVAELQESVDAENRLAVAEQELAGFDAVEYERARDRLRNQQQYDRVGRVLGALKNDVAEARGQLAHWQTAELIVSFQEATTREQAVRRSLTTVEAELATPGDDSWTSRMRRRSAMRKLRDARTDLTVELAAAEAETRRRSDWLRAAGVPEPTDAAALSRHGVAGQLAEASTRHDAVTTELARAEATLDRLRGLGLAAAQDVDVVAEQAHLADRHARLPALRAAAAAAEPRRRALEQEHGALSARIAEQRRGIEKGVLAEARLIATTLTQLALRPGLAAAGFDHVIIDEAAAAQLPHLVHALGRARIGATLVGDYLQNGPIVDQSFPGGAEVQDFFRKDCFAFFGATSPEQTARATGCVVLTEQFRFGQALTELANRVAYRGVLTTAGRGQAEIVVITVDGLPDELRDIRRTGAQAGVWMIGALLARALADLHGGDGGAEAFGVVTPYTAQKELIEAALQDAGASAIAVGTSHAFQGRQFGAVLFDLVEDGQGWMAAAALDKGSYAFDGLRLFNVAVTRARHRLYLLATRGALERARTGPLAVVQSLLEDGGATHVDAGELLGLSLDERPVEGTPTGDVLAALAPFVRVAGVHDEDAAIAEVIAAIEGATESVWCWSAWVGRHSTALIRALELASQRGVQVHVIARPKSEVTLSNQDSLERLVQRLPHVVHMRRMHQKIVVVDRMRSIVGSMNMLSHGATSSSRIRDIMFTIDGPRFADAVLRHQQAGELASCRRCPRCQAPLIECGLVGSGADRGWKWLCLQKDARGRGHPPLPFPAAEPAQRRARTRDR